VSCGWCQIVIDRADCHYVDTSTGKLPCCPRCYEGVLVEDPNLFAEMERELADFHGAWEHWVEEQERRERPWLASDPGREDWIESLNQTGAHSE